MHSYAKNLPLFTLFTKSLFCQLLYWLLWLYAFPRLFILKHNLKLINITCIFVCVHVSINIFSINKSVSVNFSIFESHNWRRVEIQQYGHALLIRTTLKFSYNLKKKHILESYGNKKSKIPGILALEFQYILYKVLLN